MDDLLSTADIAAMLGVCRRHVTERLVRRPDFPPPAVNLSHKLRRWRAKDVRAWVREASRARTRPANTPATRADA